MQAQNRTVHILKEILEQGWSFNASRDSNDGVSNSERSDGKVEELQVEAEKMAILDRMIMKAREKARMVTRGFFTEASLVKSTGDAEPNLANTKMYARVEALYLTQYLDAAPKDVPQAMKQIDPIIEE